MLDGLNQALPLDGDDLQGPPVPEGGELLNNSDLKYLSNFFTQVTFNGDTGPPMFGEGLGGYYTNDWCFPPEIVGHEVSYGTAVNGLIETDFSVMDHISLQDPQLRSPNMMLPAMSTQQPPRPQQPQQHRHRLGDQQPSPEVLAAATALSRSSGAQFDMMFSSPPLNHSVGHNQHHGYGGTGSEVNHNPLNRMMYNALGGNESYNRRTRQPMEEMRFGSDTSFNRVNFVPQSAKETTEAISAEQLATLGCLERNISAAPTRATSPTSWSPPKQAQELTDLPGQTQDSIPQPAHA